MPGPSHQPDPSFNRRAISRTEQECRLPLFEWDFASCPGQELTELHEYEFRRESPRIHGVILAWRDQTGINTFDEFLWKCRHTLTQIAPEPGHLYAFCPEWPAFPYLDIPQTERSRRFNFLFDDNAELKTMAAQLKVQPGLPGKLSPQALNLIRELLGGKVDRKRQLADRLPLLGQRTSSPSRCAPEATSELQSKDQRLGSPSSC
jgi:hypothetical protein